MNPSTSSSSSLRGSSLQAFFDPEGVAIVGASGRETNLFARPLHFLLRHGFKGGVYPVNPKYDTLAGQRCFPDVAAIGRPVELALLLVPADSVVEEIAKLGQTGTKAAVVFASGFAETGDRGRAMQAEMLAEARRQDIRILGPNCQGVVDSTTGIAATFTAAVEESLPPATGVAYVGQSGAVGGTILDMSRESGMGLSAWMSTGNQADVDSLEAAQFLIEREDVRTIMLYLEYSPDAERYARLGRTAQRLGKHIVCVRSGRTEPGQRAVVSHTGSLVGPVQAFRLMSERYGIVMVEDVDQLLRTAYSLNSTPTAAGHRIAVVTTSGGAGSLAADIFTEHGFEVPPLSKDTATKLEALIPAFGAVANPVDVTAQLFSRGSRDFPKVCELVLDDSGVDAVVVLVTMAVGEAARELAEDVVAARDRAAKPVHFVWLAGRELTISGRDLLRQAGMPVHSSITELARTLQQLRFARESNRLEHTPTLLQESAFDPVAVGVVPSKTGIVTEAGGQSLLEALGIRRPPSLLLQDPGEAELVATKLDGPYACKVQSSLLTHKTDSGAIRLDVSPAGLPVVCGELLAVATSSGLAAEDVEGVLVQTMAAPGQELLVSVMGSEGGFPPIATIGFGGVAAEVDPDVVSLLLPASQEEITSALRSLRRSPLLFGYRGKPPADIEAVVEVIEALGVAAEAFGAELEELEINPLVVYPQGDGVVALDFLARFSTEALALQ